MAKEFINYPNPVLSCDNNDYINCSFDITYEGAVENDTAKMTFRYNLGCYGLLQYIRDGKADVAVKLECSTAEYRSVYCFNNLEEMTIEIPMSMLSQLLIVKGYIIATEYNKHFRLPEFNNDFFGNIPFEINKGDILAIAEHSYRIPLKAIDPLANQSSIFVVRKYSNEKKDSAKTIFDDDRICIWLGEDTHRAYQEMNSSSEAKGLLASMFVLPALIEAFSKMENDPQTYNNYKWYQVIDDKLKSNNIDFKDGYYCAANRLLPHVFLSNINSLKAICTKNGGYE